MAGINVTGFIGALPGKDPQLLPETAAVYALNARVESGALDPISVPRYLTDIADTTKFVYRIPSSRAADIDYGYWIEFIDRDTDMIRTPVVNDGYKRYYWASPSTGFKYATQDQLISGGAAAGLVAGVPRPTVAPNLDVIAGTGADHSAPGDTALKVTRSYVVTFVSSLGEEGAPSPATEATGYADQDWRLRDIPQPVIQAGYTDISLIRIYRTVTAASGSTVFNRVADVAVGTLIYVDRISDLVVSGTLELDSTNADAPPAMDGIALMPNGVIVGFKGNNLYFSDSYKPHAWPAAYTLAVQHAIVGLGVIGTTCVVMTEGNPAAVTGASGAVMSLTQSETSLPCLSRQSIVVAPEGVYYASAMGLVLYGPSGPSIVSNDVFGNQTWENNYNPASMDAALYRGSYACAYQPPTGARAGLMVMQGSVIDLAFASEPQIGLDVYSNKPWMILGGKLYEWLPSVGTLLDVLWKSKTFVLLNRVTFGIAQIYLDPRDGLDVVFRLYGDDVLVHTQQVVSMEPFRLPAGRKYDRVRFEVETNTRVHRVLIAETVTQLKGV